jgi:hypothetical protein
MENVLLQDQFRLQHVRNKEIVLLEFAPMVSNAFSIHFAPEVMQQIAVSEKFVVKEFVISHVSATLIADREVIVMLIIIAEAEPFLHPALQMMPVELDRLALIVFARMFIGGIKR